MKAYRDDYGHIVVEDDGKCFSTVRDIYSHLQSDPKDKLEMIKWFGKATVLLVAEGLRRFGSLGVNAIGKELDQYYLPADDVSSAIQCGQDEALDTLRTCLRNGEDPVNRLLQELHDKGDIRK